MITLFVVEIASVAPIEIHQTLRYKYHSDVLALLAPRDPAL